MRYVIVTGFEDYRRLERVMAGMNPDEVVCTDELGIAWARINNCPFRYFPIEWNRYGRSAPRVRNAQMANYATHLVIAGENKHLLGLARQKGLKIRRVG